MIDSEKHVEHAERHRRHRQEIHPPDRVAMVAKERLPAFDYVRARGLLRYVARYGALAQLVAELEELGMLCGAPQPLSRIIRRISAGMSGSTRGRPTFRDFHRQ